MSTRSQTLAPFLPPGTFDEPLTSRQAHTLAHALASQQQRQRRPLTNLDASPHSESKTRAKAKSKSNTKPRKEKKHKHSPSPFQRTLYLSNLPHTIKPSHFDYILSHPNIARGRPSRGCKKDPGISMIQIYTLPYEPAKPNTFVRLFKKALCLSSARADDDIPQVGSTEEDKSKEEVSQTLPLSHSSEPSSSDIVGSNGESAQDERQAPNGALSTVESREVDLDAEDPSNPAQQPAVGQSQVTGTSNISQEGVEVPDIVERGDTIAWIHFRTEDHLYKAKFLLNSVSIDGRKLHVRCDRFNNGIIRRGYRLLCERIQSCFGVRVRARGDDGKNGLKGDEGDSSKPLAYVGVNL
ncbi:hypothetical protein IAT40_007987 [Kwoniella sp. CBS 6097]